MTLIFTDLLKTTGIKYKQEFITPGCIKYIPVYTKFL